MANTKPPQKPPIAVAEGVPPREAKESVLAYCLRGFHEDETAHQLLSHKWDRNYRSWRAILERRSDAMGWTNKQRPALVYQAIDTILAGLLDPAPRWRLRARPRMVGVGEVPNIEQLKAGVRANELLLSDELDEDNYAEKQHVFLLQNLICGLSVAKNFWRKDVGPAVNSTVKSKPIYAPNSGKIIGFQPQMVQSKQGQETYFDGPSFMPIDVRDFVWHQSATSLDTCMRVTHRVWKDFSELKDLEKQGIYKDVDLLAEHITDNQASDVLKSREQDLFATDRTKDKIELLECWIDHGRRVVTIGNRRVILRDVPNPFAFEHLGNRYPFVVCSTTPDVFRIPGVGEVELIHEIQEILWTLLNQRLDNLQLINNAIVLLRDDMDDPDSFDFYPGARNLVSDPQQVQMWTPNVNIANLSMEAEGMARNDLQNLIGASPAAQGQTDNESTATQISLVTTLAQRRLSMKKQLTKYAAKRTGEQWMAMNQQMIQHDKYVPTIGKDGELAFEVIQPLLLQGRYKITVEQLDESTLRQERRAEAQAKLQIAVQAAPVFAATGKALNLQAFMDDLLDAYDIQDKDAYYAAAQQPAMAQPQQQQQPPQPGQPTNGITSPQAADAMSPSNAFSQSGMMPMARALASRGGAVNVGQGT